MHTIWHHCVLEDKRGEKGEKELRGPDWNHIIKAACHHILQPRHLSVSDSLWMSALSGLRTWATQLKYPCQAQETQRESTDIKL